MERVLISLPSNFLKKLDETAKKEERTRSGFIREAVEFYMNKNKNE